MPRASAFLAQVLLREPLPVHRTLASWRFVLGRRERIRDRGGVGKTDEKTRLAFGAPVSGPVLEL